MGNPVGWFEIYVHDLTRAQTFYEAMLGRRLHPLPQAAGSNSPEMRVFEMDEQSYGAAGALVHMPGFEPAGGNTVLVYFSCADCATEANKAVTAGGRVVKAKMPIGPYGFIALVSDTEGNMIGLHSQA